MTSAPPAAARATGLGRYLSYSRGAACTIRQNRMESRAKRTPMPMHWRRVAGVRLGTPWREKAVGGTPQSWATHRPIMAERTQGTMAA